MFVRFLLIVLLSTTLWAQQQSDPKETAKERLQQFVKKLNLTEDQKSKIMPILMGGAESEGAAGKHRQCLAIRRQRS